MTKKPRKLNLSGKKHYIQGRPHIKGAVSLEETYGTKEWAKKFQLEINKILRDISIKDRFKIAENGIIQLENMEFYWRAKMLRIYMHKKMSDSPVKVLAFEIKKVFNPFCHKVAVAGSIRRKKINPGDIDIVCVPKNTDAFISFLNSYGGIGETNLKNRDIVTFKVNDIQLDVNMCTLEQFPPMLLWATGSANFDRMCRSVAKKNGMLLNRYGLWKRTSRELITRKSEKEILEAIGIGWYSPNERSI